MPSSPASTPSQSSATKAAVSTPSSAGTEETSDATTSTPSSVARTSARNNYAAPHTPIASAKRPRSSMNIMSPAGGAGQTRGLPETPLDEEEVVHHPLEDNTNVCNHTSTSNADEVPETPGTAAARESLDRAQLSPLHPAKPRVNVVHKDTQAEPAKSDGTDEDASDGASGWVGRQVEQIFSPMLNFLSGSDEDEAHEEHSNEDVNAASIKVPDGEVEEGDEEDGKQLPSDSTIHTGTTSQETLSEEEEKEEVNTGGDVVDEVEPLDDVLVEDDGSSQGSGEGGEDDEDEFNPYAFIASLPSYELVSHNTPKVALPPKEVDHPISLVLDLDETLVHCTVEPVDDADLIFPVVFHGMTYQVHVRLRPHLMEFLKKIQGKYEVIVFTASQKVYANELLNLLDPEGVYIQHRLYRESCLAVEGNFLKDLNVLGRDLTKTVLVDNSPHAFGYQVDNGIPIESWFEDPRDTELLKLERFMRTLQGKDDVRTVIRETFQTHKLVAQSQ